ncbi:MAG: methionyl-tRNA formyltransferase [Polyangiaceae bacterium]
MVCQPDRPAGRGLSLRAPPVKIRAAQLGVEVFQPTKIRDGSLRDWLVAKRADVAVVLAYGRILPPDVLAAPKFGCLNLHASLLPRHRGAAPIQWSLILGDTETGISLMQMDEGLDTGPVFARRRIAIDEADDTGTLTTRLGELAARVVTEDIEAAVSGRLVAEPQDPTQVTLAPPIRHEDQNLDFNQPAQSLVWRIRGLAPKPGAYATLKGKRIKLLAAKARDESVNGPPGMVTTTKRAIWISTGQGSIELLRAQPEGKGAQNAPDLINGRVLANGDCLGIASAMSP